MMEQKPRLRRQQRTHQAILDAARQILTQQGADQLSMRGIAERIDYSPAGLYEYFGSKEEIIQALCTQAHEQLRDRLLQIDASLPPVERLESLGLAYIQFALANPEIYLLMFTNPPALADMEQMLAESSSYPVLLESIRRGLDSGVFKARTGYGLNEMAYSAWALVHGIAMLRITYLAGFPLDLDAVDQETLRTFGRGLQLDGQ
jgi:AcrR family transcriptional regulator